MPRTVMITGASGGLGRATAIHFAERGWDVLATMRNPSRAGFEDFPEIDEPTADFTYARLMGAEEKVKTGYKPAELDKWAKKAKGWAKKGDVFIYFISGAKVRNPAAAQALIERLA